VVVVAAVEANLLRSFPSKRYNRLDIIHQTDMEILFVTPVALVAHDVNEAAHKAQNKSGRMMKQTLRLAPGCADQVRARRAPAQGLSAAALPA
jgi:hypothetical protein